MSTELNKDLDLDEAILENVGGVIKACFNLENRTRDKVMAEIEPNLHKLKAQILATHTPNQKIVEAVGEMESVKKDVAGYAHLNTLEAHGRNQLRTQILKDLGLEEDKHPNCVNCKKGNKK